jgi:hypothetical protein
MPKRRRIKKTLDVKVRVDWRAPKGMLDDQGPYWDEIVPEQIEETLAKDPHIKAVEVLGIRVIAVTTKGDSSE